MRIVLAILGVLGLSPALAGQAGPEASDLVRLAEAFRLARSVQPAMWPGWEATPFPVLLVGSEREFLVNAGRTPDGFTADGYSTTLQKDIWSRPRQLDPKLQATFPAFGPPAVVVVGRAETSGKASTAWVLTVLHEHFHQYQMTDPQYFSAVEQLGLAGDDQTGMWMLNYPFPYQSPDVAAAFGRVSRELGEALQRPDRAARRRFWQGYSTFLESLSERDRRYLSLQVWQEGVARYAELRVAAVAAAGYRPSLEFRALPDVQPFSTVADGMRDAILRELAAPDLGVRRRVSFYSFGAGLALLLDQDGDAWRKRYLADKFFVERYAAAG